MPKIAHLAGRSNTLALAILVSLCLSIPAHAQYQYYSQATQAHHQNGYLQQASFQQPTNDHAPFFVPPTILPYIPFNDEPRLDIPQQLTHYQPPATTQYSQDYRLQSRSWQQPAQRPTFPITSVRHKILQAANRQLGIRYRWGGNTPRQGFDCSGFTKYAMRGTNISIPRTAAQQSRASRTISRNQLRPGDMIFFKTKGRHVNHVGIYLGNGRFIHAASGGGKVMTDDLRKHYWQKRLHKYGTFLG